MEILLKTVSVRVTSIQIMQIIVQNKGKRVWKSRYDGDVSLGPSHLSCGGVAVRLSSPSFGHGYGTTTSFGFGGASQRQLLLQHAGLAARRTFETHCGLLPERL